MNFISFDTYEAVKRLCSSGVPEKQAEEIVHTILSAKEYDLSKLATKEQVAIVESYIKEQINSLKKDVALIKQDVDYLKANIATKTDLATLRSELKEDIANLKTEMANVKYDIMKWMIPLFISVIGSAVATIVTIFIKLS
ncbi:putative DUF1640 domain-containing protein [Alphaproteobacteria bacterium]